ncbi:MAG: LysR substrate-binding domain-containing protein [Gammaproteobacteria bacterium]|nr:LysR substrate-binding domain-containing protein [Gammaproteobacteria bacterium]
MSDRRIQVFHAVARLLSFTKAAEALNMTQPAVTFQIRQLEEDFNTRLFDRGHNRISLTEAGQRVFEFSARIIALYEEMEESVRELTGEITGALTVGASTTIAEYLLPSLLGSFKERYPEMNIRLTVTNTEGVVHLVEENEIDLGVVEGGVSNKQLLVETCLIDELVVIAPPAHEFAAYTSITTEQLIGQPFVFREAGSGTREVVANFFAAQGLSERDLNKSLELGSPEAIKGAVEAGMGVSIVSHAIIGKELKLGTLLARSLEPPLPRPFSFVRQRQKFRHGVMEEFLEFARHYCQAQERASASR